MADNNDIHIPSRLQIFNKLIIKFDNEYQNLLKVQGYSTDEKIELTEHLLKAIDYIREYVKTKESTDWKKYADGETELLKKYRSRLNAYTDIQFHKYFDFRLVLAHKDILTLEQLNSMKSAAEQSLSDEEIDLFLSDVKHLLSLSLHFLYLSDTGMAEPVPQPPVTLNDSGNVTDEPDKDVTKARQLLAIYYFLKASLGIEARDKNSASGIARFIHLMTGTKFTTIQNSDIYKKYLRMPNYKTDSKLIEDLKFIRPYFIDLGLESAIKMVDEEIKRAIKELPYNERKKYKGELE
jgi:sulfur relay (sulfurtransferase) DsrC/TusE family protein